MLDSKIQNLMAKFSTLKASRSNYESWWTDVRDLISRQTKNPKRQLDTTASWANEQFANELQSILTNPTQKWFHLSTKDQELMEDDAIRQWVEDCEDTLYQVFNDGETGFSNRLHELYLDLGLYGTAVMWIQEAPETHSGVRFFTRPIQQCYIAEDHYEKVNLVFREFEMEQHQIKSRWSSVAFSDEEAIFTAHKVIHIVCPSTDKVGFDSYYILVDQDELLEEYTYEYFPYIVPRWSKEGGEVYGSSPSQVALSDVRLLNMTKRDYLRLSQKHVDPPLMVPNTTFGRALDTNPGVVNVYERSMQHPDIVQQLPFGNLAPSIDIMARAQEAIIKAYYLDALRLRKEDKTMTATESRLRREEQFRLLSPLIGRFEKEGFDPLINTVFKILIKYQKIVPPEVDLPAGTSLEIEYVSPISMAQRRPELEACQELLMMGEALAKYNPMILDNLDFDAILRHHADVLRVPHSLLRNERDIRKIRELRQQQEVMRAEQENAAAIQKGVPES